MAVENKIRERASEVFWAFLALGLTSFGGPVAHLGYFRTAFVERRQWLSEQAYADLVALCQFLPGPASSQVGFALGLMRAGPWGAAIAWLAFTLPSAIVLVLFALVRRMLASLCPAKAPLQIDWLGQFHQSPLIPRSSS